MIELEAGAALDRQIAERVMGLTLDWGHTEILGWINDDLPFNRDCNSGRGLWCSCPGCGVSAPANEMDWAAGCPTPAALPYSTDLAAALTVFLTAAANYDLPMASILWARDRWVVMCGRGQAWQGWARGIDALPLAICRAALAEQEGRA